jgi:hypothetical protein
MPEGGRYPHAGVSMAEHRMTPIFDRAVSNDKIILSHSQVLLSLRPGKARQNAGPDLCLAHLRENYVRSGHAGRGLWGEKTRNSRLNGSLKRGRRPSLDLLPKIGY